MAEASMVVLPRKVRGETASLRAEWRSAPTSLKVNILVSRKLNDDPVSAAKI